MGLSLSSAPVDACPALSNAGAFWRLVRHALASLLIGVLFCHPTLAQPGDGDWERLPDGRVVIEIYGRRLAFPPDMPRGQVVFQHGRRDAPLSEVIADRAEMERWWTGAHPSMPVGIALSASLVAPLLFGGPAPMDPAAVRPGPVFWIWVYQDPEWTDCRRTQSEVSRRICRHFIERARDDTAIGPDNFIVERPDFMRGTDQVYHVFPERERRVALGDPASIGCQEYSRSLLCENRSLRWGYFLRSGFFLRYQYWIAKPHQPDMRAIDDAFRAVAERLLLDPRREGG